MEALAPVPHIQGTKVVWNEKELLLKDEQARSVIKVYDLLRRETTMLYAPENYELKSPAIFGNQIAYLKITRTDPVQKGKQAVSDVYLYDLEKGREIRVTRSGKAEQPAIWNGRVAWLEDTGSPLGANVFLWESEKNAIQQLTRAGEADLPTLGQYFLTWHNASLKMIPVYNFAQGVLAIVDRELAGKPYTAENILVWLWSEPTQKEKQQAQWEIRVQRAVP